MPRHKVPICSVTAVKTYVHIPYQWHEYRSPKILNGTIEMQHIQ